MSTVPYRTTYQEYLSSTTRQAFLTFGDKTWVSIKVGQDLGIYAGDALLSDMSLLGIGNVFRSDNSYVNGRIGTGYQYADWKAQLAYTTPNINGFQATVGIAEAFSNNISDGARAAPSYEGKASYSFAANNVTGKVV